VNGDVSAERCGGPRICGQKLVICASMVVFPLLGRLRRKTELRKARRIEEDW